MDLTIPDGATDIDLTLGFNVDREGTLEANDALRFEIVDLTDNSVLASLELADDADFPVGDTYTTLESLANEGLTDVQARLIFLGGFADGDAEEIQIGAPSFSAAFTLPVPEPASVAIWSLIGAGLAGFAYLGRRRKS